MPAAHRKAEAPKGSDVPATGRRRAGPGTAREARGAGRPKPWRQQAKRLAWPAVATVLSVAAFVAHPDLVERYAPAQRQGPATEVLRVLLGAASYLTAAWFGARLFALALERSGRRRRSPKLLRDLATAGLFLASGVAILALVMDQSALGALATSGVVVAVLGFALRNVIADVVSGMALGLEQSYRIGDWLQTDGGVSGRVIEINWRTTRLLTRDQTHLILPNGRIAQQQLTNYSAPRREYRAQLRLTLDHAIPVVEGKRLLRAAADEAPIILHEPPPDVRVVAYEAAGVTYVVRYWVPSFAEEIDCRDAVLSAIDAALREQDLPAPRARLMATIAGAPFGGSRLAEDKRRPGLGAPADRGNGGRTPIRIGGPLLPAAQGQAQEDDR